MKSILLPLLFGLFTIGSGVVHGIFTERWSVSNNIEEAIARLQSIPMVIGDWIGEPAPIEDGSFQRVGIRGYSSIQYVNKRTGAKFTTLIVGGRSGPISVHTPDVCYAGAGYDLVGEKEIRTLKVGSNQSEKFWFLRVEKPMGFKTNKLEICWVWNRGRGWEAPTNARVSLASGSVLFKLYVILEVSPQSGDIDLLFKEFLSEFLPQANEVLFPPKL